MKPARLTVSSLGEFGLIERLLSRFSVRNPRSVIVGPGDDAAVMSLGRGERLVLTTDMLVEGTHFRLGWSYPRALGYKAVTSSLSDVAAMGGKPIGIVISLGVPPTIPLEAVDKMYAGVARALARFGGELLGGDTVCSRRVVVCVSAIGLLIGRRPLLRSTARPGDSICVTGSLGRSEAGLLLLKKYFKRREHSRRTVLAAWARRDPSYFKDRLPSTLRNPGYACIERHLMPTPRTGEARAIAESHPSSMIDLSDGLSSDLGQIMRASKVGVEVDERRIPVHPCATHVARKLGVSHHRIATSSGEEYELVFTLSPARVEMLCKKLKTAFGTTVTVVGEVKGGRTTGWLTRISGKRTRLVSTGFRHF